MHFERLTPITTLPVRPRGLLRDYQPATGNYVPPSKLDFWHAIVTDIRPAENDEAPYVFSLAGGISNNHSEIAHAIGRGSEPSHRLTFRGDKQTRNVFLRLSGERDANGATRLIAEILPGGKPEDTTELVGVGASLLQAGVQSGDNPSGGWDSFAVYINATSHLQQTWLLDTTNPNGIVTAVLDS